MIELTVAKSCAAAGHGFRRVLGMFPDKSSAFGTKRYPLPLPRVRGTDMFTHLGYNWRYRQSDKLREERHQEAVAGCQEPRH